MFSRILLLGVIVPTATAFGAGNPTGKERSLEQFVPGKDSYRAAFSLDVPRRFATRYLRDTRSLELRVSPARASEFDVGRFYDTRFIHRAVVEEKNGDVVLSFQLKNAPVAWLVTHQDNPWRIVVDIWRTEPFEPRSLDQEWSWQDDAAGNSQDVANTTAPTRQSQTTPKAVKPVEIDLPGEDHTSQDTKRQETNAQDTSVKTQSAAASNSGISGRLESIEPISANALAALERQAGADAGTIAEFDSVEKLATALYRAGRTAQAGALFKRLTSLNARRFQDSPRLLWMAGESAFIEGKPDLANDYLQTLVARFPGHEIAALGQLRMTDLRASRPGGPAVQDLNERYTEIALNDRAVWAARIGASIRLLEPVVSSRPEAARAHQAALQSCLNGRFVSEAVRASCAYIQTKFAVSQLDVVSADSALQRYRTAYPNDPRTAGLSAELADKVKFVVDELARKKDFPAIAEFERSARPGLLDFTLRDPGLLMTRVEGWLSVGDSKRALALLQVFASNTTDETRRNEAYSLIAQLNFKLQSSEKAEAALKKLFASDVRKNVGLSDRATAALKESARSPYSSKTAQYILIDEMKIGRYVERDVGMLVTLAVAARGREDADKVFDVLLTTSPRNDDEARRIETSLMGWADDLRNNGRLAKSGDVYLAVANLAQTTKKAEASYKAGLVYARAGMVEKAKTAWQISAADVTDKKFSSLANERLERIR
jgi:tetratricopeptide (TPR) repeat protein